MTYTVKPTGTFKNDVKRVKKRGYDISLLEYVVTILASGETLPDKYKDHPLKGKEYMDCRECHIQPDWLLVYKIKEEELFLYLTRTGTHSDIF